MVDGPGLTAQAGMTAIGCGIAQNLMVVTLMVTTVFKLSQMDVFLVITATTMTELQKCFAKKVQSK